MFQSKNIKNFLKNRFRGFYPVVIDVETAGFDPYRDALLEIAIITLRMDDNGFLRIDNKLHFNIIPTPGLNIKKSALKFNKIDPYNPFRAAINERKAIKEIFNTVRLGIKKQSCSKAVVVAHNAYFDHSFLMSAVDRSKIKYNPFHSFSTFDTATLSGLVLGQTVLSKACIIAGIEFNNNYAHSALYDSKKTAELFCEIVNRWKKMGGWPIPKNRK
ncbi:rnt [Wigglesworthia glossinidia endosymbiont of Glossina brevipalpis]|uniref:Ribonuclease T n=1 Tax=Wigglesworthia glossinidia brevipalpis TaxID=36870 RepID=RNT_WIGBR|nr:RecName: Full=Ribonuclease T; AltName: Full=Exoribonuclease T; Short=RNase T [Wigglesworthia glossinidia endosymbiont of Glossina brevipalpis]BAC24481.1 rnt [Wigglesworthia glossinidia endosymbiont of Glossina brevipalpis]